MARRTRRFRDLPLLWRLLVPFAMLLLIVGVAGGLVIVRDLTSRAQTSLDRDLAQRALEANTTLHNRELYLLESANLAANLRGMADALDRGDTTSATELLGSVRALKPDLTLLALIDARGGGVIEFLRDERDVSKRSKGNRPRPGFVARALRDAHGARRSGLATIDGRSILAIVAPVCRSTDPCDVVGAALVGIAVDRLVAEASGAHSVANNAVGLPVGVAIYDPQGMLIAAGGSVAMPDVAPDRPGDRPARLTAASAGEEIATLFGPFQMQGRSIGTLAVAMPASPAFASARAAGFRLVWILLVALVAIVTLGALLSRSILAQVRPLVDTNRALATGDLSARAAVLGNDELGELARGVNQMAEQLQASHGTLEARVAERTAEVQRLLEERSDLFAGLSHELRTPLALILGNAELLLDPAAPRAKVWRTETTAAIADSAEHLLGLVNDILDLAKAERGMIDLQPEELRPAELLDELRPAVDGLVRDQDLHVTLDIPDDLPVVHGDRKRLKEVLLNLVDNAIKYTPSGGSVAVTGSARNGHVEIAVSDTGPGIPETVGDRVFEPFYRVDGVRPRRGRASSGLGLAVSQRFVEAHDGAIWFESEPGGGTTFRFTVPHRS